VPRVAHGGTVSPVVLHGPEFDMKRLEQHAVIGRNQDNSHVQGRWAICGCISQRSLQLGYSMLMPVVADAIHVHASCVQS
jgi:hypothetical protein